MRRPTRRLWIVVMAIGLYLQPCASANESPDAPATRPAVSPQQRFERLERLKQGLAQLDLDETQRQQVADLFSQLQKDVQKLRTLRQSGQPVLAQRRQMLLSFRQNLIQILTPDQRKQLRQFMNGQTQPATEPSDQASSPDQPPPKEQSQPPSTRPASVGTVAPPFHLATPEGIDVSLARFKGRVVVLEFGSLTSPTFRDQAPAMERLNQRYDQRVFFLVVYTREAHPAGQWDVARNQDDGISIPQSKDMDERRNLADRARRGLDISAPVLVDTMDDAVSTAYGGFPDATFVIGRDGKIVGRQQWTDPSGLPRLIEAALTEK